MSENQITCKDFGLEELKDIFRDYKFKLFPRWHQYATFAFCLDKSRVMLWHDIGTGKTITALYMMEIWGVDKVFVVCPNSCIRSWAKQTRDNTNYKFVALTGTTWDRRDLLTSPLLQKHKKLVCCINYEGLKYLFGEKRKTVRFKDGKQQSKNKFMVDFDWLSELKKAGFVGFIGDEAHSFQNKDALQSKIGYQISKNMDYVVLMSGSPGDELGWWSEYYTLNLGASLGQSIWKYQLSHFKQNYWGSWSIRDQQESAKILKLISPVTIRFNKSECFDLPDIIRERREGTLLPKQKAVYNKLKDDGVALVDGKELTIETAIGMVNKLRQVISGFFLEHGEIKLSFPSIKIELLKEVLEEITGKVMIFHHYVQEGRLIEQLLKKKNIRFASMRGEIKDKDKEFNMFIKNPSVRVLVLNPQSGGEGLDGFQHVCSTVIFFSNSGKGARIREQCEGRIFRDGQKETCTFIDLVVMGTVDEEIIKDNYDERKATKKLLRWMQERGGVIKE